MGFSLKQAADAAGVGKSTIFRAVKSGRLSAGRTDDGTLDIQPAELFRAFPPKPERTEPPERPATVPPEVEERIRQLEERLSEMRADRDRWHEAATKALERPLMLPAPSETAARRSWWPWRRSA